MADANRDTGLYADYWCWSGTNSKGKTGVFPQAYIDLQSLKRQDAPVNRRLSRGRGLFGSRSTANAKGTPKSDTHSRGSAIP